MTRFDAIVGVILASLIAAGCDPEAEPCAPCRPASPELRALQNTSWLVRRVVLPTVDRSSTAAAGVDVDGVDSGLGDPSATGNCAAFGRDHVSSLAPRVRGIDAVLSTILDPLVEALEPGRTPQGDLDAAMAEGRIRWALHIGELDERDESIEVDVMFVDEHPSIGADGQPLAGQVLRARSVSRREALSYGSSAFARTETEALAVTGRVSLLPLDRLRVAGVLVSAELADGGLRAHLGGSFSVDALVEVAERDAPTFGAGPWLTSRWWYEGAADVQPSADPAICERVSVGFELEAVPVVLVVD